MDIIWINLKLAKAERKKNNTRWHINIPLHNYETKGYKIMLPSDCLSKVYIYPKVPVEYIEKLYKIDSIKNQVVLLESIKDILKKIVWLQK